MFLEYLQKFLRRLLHLKRKFEKCEIILSVKVNEESDANVKKENANAKRYHQKPDLNLT